MRSRREFFRRAAQMSGSAGLAALLLESVERAQAIDADPGTTFLDAEHIVVLMQENRSFDHAYGTLRGVRGFGDPRAVTLPGGNPVWLQTNDAGETYAPFRLDIKETNSTWLGSLPHSWRDQTDARNHGNHDKWLDAKPSGRRELAGKPLTLGYYDRNDLPFYYALADAFTICDQNFCSSLTGTTANRLYLMTGTIRQRQHPDAPANLRNADVDYGSEQNWPTFPERLEDAGVSWKIYQNEISLISGLGAEEAAWLANFTDNPIEWFDQYRVNFSQSFRSYAAKAVNTLPAEIAEIDRQLPSATGAAAARLTRDRAAKERNLKRIREAAKFTDEAWSKLSQRDRNLHEKAFDTNAGDPAYRELATLRYRDGGTEREMKVPKGDVLYQFRKDVREGKLPEVSWLVPPENFSDHPGAPWYGAWMVSEVLNILTQKPEVWKKTIVILTYDENDGYFDHVPPFVAPDPSRPETGKTTAGIDASVEYWPLERDLEKRTKAEARGGPVGLGYRVPMVVASPWSRGGYVCSQVLDHTSVLQLMERVLNRKPGRKISESNISAWRRAVCGDLSSAFEAAGKTPEAKLQFPQRNAVLEAIHKAQFKQMPAGFRKLAPADIAAKTWMTQQEKGVRPSRPLPYRLNASGRLSGDGKAFEITMEAGKTAGSAFHVYTPGTYRKRADLRTRAYAVEAGKQLSDTWDLTGFENNAYHLCVCGPNGFLREFSGTGEDPAIQVHCEYVNGDIEVVVTNHDRARSHSIRIEDQSYGTSPRSAVLKPAEKKSIQLRLQKSYSWYDFTLTVAGAGRYFRRCAGRVETAKSGFSDPAIGRSR